MKRINITIDGPSGAGKSSLAKEIAKHFDIIYVDTGALYRAIGLFVCRKGIASTDTENIVPELKNIALDIKYVDGVQRIYLCGEDVSDKIRTNEISKYASDVSAIKEVREFLLDTQRSLAKHNSVVMDGRDIGTVILPKADIKIFMTASAEVRAKRRYKELLEKGQSTTYEEVLEAIIIRDKNDSSRAIAPLKPASDAILLDNSNLNFEENLKALIDIINEKGALQ